TASGSGRRYPHPLSDATRRALAPRSAQASVTNPIAPGRCATNDTTPESDLSYTTCAWIASPPITRWTNASVTSDPGGWITGSIRDPCRRIQRIEDRDLTEDERAGFGCTDDGDTPTGEAIFHRSWGTLGGAAGCPDCHKRNQ